MGTIHISIDYTFGRKVNDSRVDCSPHVKTLSLKVNALVLGKVFNL